MPVYPLRLGAQTVGRVAHDWHVVYHTTSRCIIQLILYTGGHLSLHFPVKSWLPVVTSHTAQELSRDAVTNLVPVVSNTALYTAWPRVLTQWRQSVVLCMVSTHHI